MPDLKTSIEQFEKKLALFYPTAAPEEKAAFAAYQQQLNLLYAELDRFLPGAGREARPLSAEDIEFLKAQYKMMLDETQRFQETAGSLKKTPVIQAHLDITAELGELIRQDYRTLIAAPGLEGKTLEEITAEAREKTVDIGEQELSSLRGGVNDRKAVAFTDEKGRHEGFFTQNSEFDAEKAISELEEQYEKEHPEYMSVYRALCNSDTLSDYSVVISRSEETKYGMREYRRMFEAEALEECTKMYSESTPEEIREKIDTLMKDNSFSKATLPLLTKRASLLATKKAQYGDDGPKMEGRKNIADRNVAMSIVANLLGVPHLIARSYKMELIENGVPKQGVFMEKAVGCDLRDYSDDNPLGELTDDNPYEPELMKQKADLQMLDSICGNTDRHDENIFYQVGEKDGKKVITGIQGIDNDMSMGTIDNSQKVSYLPGGDELFVCSQSMADKIMGLTPEMLKTALAGLSLTENEVNAACKRLTDMQERIVEGREYFRQNPDKDVEVGHLKIVADEEWSRYSPKYFHDKFKQCGNYFTQIIDLPEKFKKNRENHKANVADFQKFYEANPDLKEEKKPFRMTEGKVVGETDRAGLARNRRGLAELGAELKKVNKGFFISSGQFDTVKTELAELTKAMNALQPGADKASVDKIKEHLQKLNKAAGAYLSKKNGEAAKKLLSGTARKRRAFVQRLQAFTQDRLDGLKKEQAPAAFAAPAPEEKKPDILDAFRESLSGTSMTREQKEQAVALKQEILAQRLANAADREQPDPDRCSKALGLYICENMLRSAIRQNDGQQLALLTGKAPQETVKDAIDRVKANDAVQEHLKNLPAQTRDQLLSTNILQPGTLDALKAAADLIKPPVSVSDMKPGRAHVIGENTLPGAGKDLPNKSAFVKEP